MAIRNSMFSMASENPQVFLVRYFLEKFRANSGNYS